MAYKVQPSFAAGELDPAMHELTNLQKYKTGLARLRGFCVGKTGRLISLPGTTYDILTKEQDASKPILTYFPEFSKYQIEFGHLYLRIHNLDTGTFVEVAHNVTQENLPKVHFAYSGQYLYFSEHNRPFYRLVLGDLDPDNPDLAIRLIDGVTLIQAPPPLSSFDITITPNGTPAGYDVEYVATYMTEDEESYASFGNPVEGKLPVAASQYNIVSVIVTKPTLQIGKIKEVRIYRRAKDGTDYGYIGSTDTYTAVSVGSDTANTYTFRDVGGAADYTSTPPETQADFAADTTNYVMGGRIIMPSTVYVYQQRLVINGTLEKNKEVTFTSRPGMHNNFLRDFPLTASSALAMKSGTSGTSEILRYLDMGGLAAFTTRGLFVTANGPLVPETASMTRRGNWVIDETVEPLVVPGGFLFVEKATGAVIQINYSNELDGFSGGELTIFSDHLFRGKRVKSWAYQSGIIPLIWIVMNDGTCNVLTYVPEQQMTAWAWTDTDGVYETVGVHKKVTGEHEVYFTVFRNGMRMREKLSPRFNVDFKEFNGAHSSKIFKSEIFNVLVAAVTPGVWDDELTLNTGVASFANTAGNGAVGSVFRYFDKVTGSRIDLEVVEFISTIQVKVVTVNDRTFPVDQINNATLYRVFDQVTGLDHLNGKQVYVRLDGFTEGSPLERDENGNHLYNIYTVVGGSITLQDDKSAGVLIVGLPQVQDFQLLDVDTVEQQPATLASVSLVKMYLKYFNSRGIYTGNEFPEDDTTTGMIDTERQDGDDETELFNGSPQLPYTKRVEIMTAGSWSSHGMMCARNVSGNPVEILSVISDLEVDRR